MPSPAIGDAFGLALLAELENPGDGVHVVERDDGYVEPFPAAAYFQAFGAWGSLEAAGLDLVSGRILDVGAGAGRAALDLQERGHRVTALDVSPGAIEVCRRRGVFDTFLGTAGDLAVQSPEPFDSFVLFGNNLGLMDSPEAAPGFLAGLAVLARPGAILVGTNRDAAVTDFPSHLEYHELNRQRGRSIGHLTIRTRFQNLATPWHGLYFASRDEVGLAAEAGGWEVEDFRQSGAEYLAVLRRSG